MLRHVYVCPECSSVKMFVDQHARVDCKHPGFSFSGVIGSYEKYVEAEYIGTVEITRLLIQDTTQPELENNV